MAAAEGSISEAIALARQAAELAASQDQPAVEVVALHTAVCFGDRTLADRLVVSVRAIEGHLYRACAKLGVSDRSELAPLLHGD